MKYLLWPMAIILLVGWVLGFFVFKIMGGLIHLLLVVVAILVVYNFFTAKKS